MDNRDDEQRTNVPVITQDKEEYPTATRQSDRVLRSETRALTDEFLYNAMEFPGITTNITEKSTATRKYPQQFITDWANAVIDKETGELMEYRHLLKDPKHRERWQNSFGKEIRRLATTMETIKFICWRDIPKERLSDTTYARIVCTERPEKKGSRSNPNNNGRKPCQLSGRLRHTHSQSPNGENAIQQCHIDSTRQIHDN